MKKLWIVFLVATFVLMAACGVKDTISVETGSTPDTEWTSVTEEVPVETETTDIQLETTTETMSTTKIVNDAKDWKTAYIDYLKTLTEDSD